MAIPIGTPVNIRPDISDQHLQDTPGINERMIPLFGTGPHKVARHFAGSNGKWVYLEDTGTIVWDESWLTICGKEPSPKTCTCDILVLLSKGCQCGGL